MFKYIFYCQINVMCSSEGRSVNRYVYRCTINRGVLKLILVPIQYDPDEFLKLVTPFHIIIYIYNYYLESNKRLEKS